MNAQCKVEFGATARMATSADVAKNPPVAALITRTAWVRGVTHPSDVGIDNTTGIDFDSDDNMNCDSWTSSSGTRSGLSLNTDKLLLHKNSSCDSPLHVLCAVESGVEQQYEFVGFSSNSVQASSGYQGLTDSCRLDFGNDARIATTQDVSVSNLGTAQTDVAWVQGIAHASNSGVDAVTGANTGVVNERSLTCEGWSGYGGGNGLIVDGSDFSIRSQGCYLSSVVACSLPK